MKRAILILIAVIVAAAALAWLITGGGALKERLSNQLFQQKTEESAKLLTQVSQAVTIVLQRQSGNLQEALTQLGNAPENLQSPFGAVVEGGPQIWVRPLSYNELAQRNEAECADMVVAYDRGMYAMLNEVNVVFGNGRMRRMSVREFERQVESSPNRGVYFQLPGHQAEPATSQTMTRIQPLVEQAVVPPQVKQEIERNSVNEGLVAYYPFNGNANDSSGYGNNGVANGVAVTADRFGNPNGAFSFNGVDSYISVNHADNLNLPEKWTISIWLTLKSAAPYYFPYHIIEKSGSWEFRQRENELHFIAPGLIAEFVSANYSFQYDTWYNVVIRYEGSNISIYVNGTLTASNPATGALQATSNPLQIGRYTPGGNYYFNGIIDEVRIYNRALSDSEIKKLASQ